MPKLIKKCELGSNVPYINSSSPGLSMYGNNQSYINSRLQSPEGQAYLASTGQTSLLYNDYGVTPRTTSTYTSSSSSNNVNAPLDDHLLVNRSGSVLPLNTNPRFLAYNNETQLYIDDAINVISQLLLGTKLDSSADTGGDSGNDSGGVPGGNGLWLGIAMGSKAASSLIPTTKSDEVKVADSVFDSVAAGMMTINPMVGGIMMAGGLLSDGLNALGLRTDQVTTMDKILGSKFLTLTPTALMNNSFTTRLHKLRNDFDVQNIIARMGGGYGGFMKNWEEALKYSGKKVGMLNDSNALNSKIGLAGGLLATLDGIFSKLDLNDKVIADLLGVKNEWTMNDLNGGPGNIRSGRIGLKFDYSKLLKVHELLNKPKTYNLKPLEEEVKEFKDGGKMNVIPEGSLHARLHHMENAEGLTKKGIPVVTIAEGGLMEQLAEIELNEIIFNLDVTTELEKLMKDGSDNAAIEAGKLLVKEIFENTDDRTGLIKLLEPEKKEPTTEDIVKNHQVFLTGGILPNLNNIEELVDLAIQLNPQFVQRIGDDMGYAEFTDENGKILRGTHLLGYAEDNGEYLVFPNILMENGRLQYEKDWKKAFDKAKRAGNVVRFKNQSDAEKFTKEYKKSRLWKPYFDIWELKYGSFKNGGVIEKINNLSPEQLEKLTKFLNEV